MQRLCFSNRKNTNQNQKEKENLAAGSQSVSNKAVSSRQQPASKAEATRQSSKVNMEFLIQPESTTASQSQPAESQSQSEPTSPKRHRAGTSKVDVQRSWTCTFCFSDGKIRIEIKEKLKLAAGSPPASNKAVSSRQAPAGKAEATRQSYKLNLEFPNQAESATASQSQLKARSQSESARRKRHPAGTIQVDGAKELDLY